MDNLTKEFSKQNKTWQDLVRTVFPDLNDQQCDDILWNYTGFPCFWKTDDPAREILDVLKVMERTANQMKRNKDESA